MYIVLDPGKYVVAVSGGIDSVALLDMLSKSLGIELVVAHYDHGIREDSAKDRKFVEKLAKKYKLPFYFAEGRLGPAASEATAREKRYEFLRKIKTKTKSKAIITAHHQDDLVETAIMNIIRGTGRKGLSSLRSTKQLIRPLLAINKERLIMYAQSHGLAWREDPTNTDRRYFRNFVRHAVVPKLPEGQKKQLLSEIETAGRVNLEIDTMLSVLYGSVFACYKIKRRHFTALSHDFAKELLANWLRRKSIPFSAKTLERLVIFIKTAKPGTKTNIGKNWHLQAGKDIIRLIRR